MPDPRQKPPVFSPLVSVELSSKGPDQYKEDIAHSIDKWLEERKFGAWQIFYVLAMCLGWSFVCSLSQTEKFLLISDQDYEREFDSRDKFGLDKYGTFEDYSMAYTDDNSEDDLKKHNLFTWYHLDKVLIEDAEGGKKPLTPSTAASEVNTYMYLSWMVSCIIYSVISDRVKGKWIFAPALLLSVVGQIMITWPWYDTKPENADKLFLQMKICKAVSWIGCGSLGLATYMWMNEFIPTRWNAILAILPNVFWAFGQISVGSVKAYFLNVQHVNCFVCAGGALMFLFLPGIWHLPMARWSRHTPTTKNTNAKGRAKKLIAVLDEIDQVNTGGKSPNIEIDLPDVSDQYDNVKEENPDKLSTPQWVVQLLVNCIIWFAWALAFWGLTNTTSNTQSVFDKNVSNALTAVIGYAFSYFVCEIVQDHRLKLTICYVPALFFLWGSGLSRLFLKMDDGANLMCHVANIFLCAASSAVYVVTPDIFRHNRVQTSMGLVCMTARLGGYASEILGKDSMINLYKGLFVERWKSSYQAWMTNKPEEISYKGPGGSLIFASEGLTSVMFNDNKIKLEEWPKPPEDGNTFHDLNNATMKQFIEALYKPLVFSLPVAVALVLIWTVMHVQPQPKKETKSFMKLLRGFFPCQIKGANWGYFFKGKQIIFTVGVLLMFAYYVGFSWPESATILLRAKSKTEEENPQTQVVSWLGIMIFVVVVVFSGLISWLITWIISRCCGQAKGNFQRKFEFFMQLAGYAIGLGNIWRFPLKVANNGGFPAVVVYLLCSVFVAFPCYMWEMAIGQEKGKTSVKAFEEWCPSLALVGWAQNLVTFGCLAYFQMIIGWALYYLVRSFKNPLPWINEANDQASKLFWTEQVLQVTQTVESGSIGAFVPHLCGILAIIWLITYGAVIGGEKVLKQLTVPVVLAPIVIMLILVVAAVSQDGYGDGVEYYLTPANGTFGKTFFNIDTWTTMGGQVLFSLGPGFGTMFALSSSEKGADHNMIHICASVVCVNAIFSIVGGIAVFGFIGAAAKKQIKTVPSYLENAKGGQSLIFVEFAQALGQLETAGQMLAPLVFAMLVCLGLDTSFAFVSHLRRSVEDMLGNYAENSKIPVSLVCVACFVTGLVTVCQSGETVVDAIDCAVGWGLLLCCAVEMWLFLGYHFKLFTGWQNFRTLFFENMDNLGGRPSDDPATSTSTVRNLIMMAMTVLSTLVLSVFTAWYFFDALRTVRKGKSAKGPWYCENKWANEFAWILASSVISCIATPVLECILNKLWPSTEHQHRLRRAYIIALSLFAILKTITSLIVWNGWLWNKTNAVYVNAQSPFLAGVMVLFCNFAYAAYRKRFSKQVGPNMEDIELRAVSNCELHG